KLRYVQGTPLASRAATGIEARMTLQSPLMHWSDEEQGLESPAPKRPPRPWRQKFRDALRGVKLGIRGHGSFFVHFFFAALVITAAGTLRCTLEQWCILLGCIGVVLTAELFNSAIETLVRDEDGETNPRYYPALDIAAGAVLLASAVAAVIGTLIFLSRL